MCHDCMCDRNHMIPYNSMDGTGIKISRGTIWFHAWNCMNRIWRWIRGVKIVIDKMVKYFRKYLGGKKNKPGTAQVGAISKAQKDSKTTFSTTGDNKSSQKTKN